jgi:hypothetical protein
VGATRTKVGILDAGAAALGTGTVVLSIGAVVATTGVFETGVSTTRVPEVGSPAVVPRRLTEPRQ